jgi:Zn-dependent protease with chaperone function
MAYAIGFVIHQTIGPPEVALFIVIAMLYVTLARGRLIGSSVMIHEAQYPRVFSIVRRACAALEIPMPLVFVREDIFVPAAALGFGEPYALVLSSNWIEHFQDDELAFVIGRQLGHIAAGHTRFLSLLSVNGNENPIIALIFGAWLRCCDYTCDRVGLLVCGSLDAAMRAIAVSSFHHFGRNVDLTQFEEQGREIAKDSVLRWGEWMGAEPYATNRIAAMRAFEASAQFAQLEEWFLREVAVAPPPAIPYGNVRVDRSDCAGIWRRLAALTIDAVVVSAMVLAFNNVQASRNQSPLVNINGDTGSVKVGGIVDISADESPAPSKSPAKSKAAQRTSTNPLDTPSSPVYAAFTNYASNFGWLPLYLAVLVGFTGQSFGMMIAGLRVVTQDFRQPGIPRSIWRYSLALLLWLPIAMIAPFTGRVMLHDRLSGTRLVRAERILARATTNPAR